LRSLHFLHEDRCLLSVWLVRTTDADLLEADYLGGDLPCLHALGVGIAELALLCKNLRISLGDSGLAD